MSDKLAAEVSSLTKRIEELERIVLHRNKQDNYQGKQDNYQGKNAVSTPGAVKIYVGNLSYGVDEEELNRLFRAFGEVSSVSIVLDKFSGKSRGFGFVEMPGREDAMKAIDNINGKEIKGRKLNVNESRPRENRGDSRPGRDRKHGGGYGGGRSHGFRFDRGRRHDRKDGMKRDGKFEGFRDKREEKDKGRGWGSNEDKGKDRDRGKDKEFSRDNKKKFYSDIIKKRKGSKSKINSSSKKKSFSSGKKAKKSKRNTKNKNIKKKIRK